MGQDVAVKILNAKVTNQLTKDFDAELALMREFRRFLFSFSPSLFFFFFSVSPFLSPFLNHN